jgi:hypothetical protein
MHNILLLPFSLPDLPRKKLRAYVSYVLLPIQHMLT